MINSVCGCAAGNARPAVKLATKFDVKPDVFATVFAGQDIGATAKQENTCFLILHHLLQLLFLKMGF